VDASPGRTAFGLASGFIKAKDKGGGMDYDRTKVMTGPVIDEERAKSDFLGYQGREFLWTYPFVLE